MILKTQRGSRVTNFAASDVNRNKLEHEEGG